jgi:maltose alpha-D-glucosyltransferase/alpha-amylase
VVRSIDYAATAAAARAVQSSPDEHGRLTHALDGWRRSAEEAFIGAYREFLTDARLWPSEPAHADRLLRFFLLEKVVYEVEYELANRPDWLHVPLTGLARLLTEHSGSS